jgi:hypothetical protein
MPQTLGHSRCNERMAHVASMMAGLGASCKHWALAYAPPKRWYAPKQPPVPLNWQMRPHAAPPGCTAFPAARICGNAANRVPQSLLRRPSFQSTFGRAPRLLTASMHAVPQAHLHSSPHQLQGRCTKNGHSASHGPCNCWCIQPCEWRHPPHQIVIERQIHSHLTQHKHIVSTSGADPSDIPREPPCTIGNLKTQPSVNSGCYSHMEHVSSVGALPNTSSSYHHALDAAHAQEQHPWASRDPPWG